jgi:hypothetical protein
MAARLALAAVAALLVALEGGAGAQEYENAEQAAATARRLQDAGRWVDAAALLTSRLPACDSDPQARACRLLLNFSLGYLSERQATLEPNEAAGLLGEAAGYYRKVLAEAPDHAATVNNLALVYRKLGDAAATEALLRAALDRLREGRSAFALMLGDLYREGERLDPALDAYGRAAGDTPDAETPRRRIVEVYGLLPIARTGELFQRLSQWEARFPSVADAGYLGIIERSFQGEPRLAEEALVRWVSLLARNRWISARRLADLPAAWQDTPVREIRLYVENPDRPPQAGWWRQRSERGQVLVEVALALGSERLVQGDIRGAAARWEVGQAIAPDVESYLFGDLRGARFVRLDLQTDLASLYAKYEFLDPGGQKFARLLGSLFQGKADAYAADDLEAIQRHHTVLGMIYAERGTWTSETHRWMNAIFQLEHAIGAAERRERQTGYYQPLSELRARLAKGYAALGRTAQARSASIAAARAYLDSDQLEQAGAMLNQARPLLDAAPQADQSAHARLTTMLETRRLIAGADSSALDPSAATYPFRANGPHAWIFGASAPAMSDALLGRQRFKALSDLAARTKAQEHAGQATAYTAQAFNVAVAEVPALIGTEDLVRLEKVTAGIADRVRLDRWSPVVESTRPAGATGKTWQLFLATAARPAFARVDADTVLAGRIVALLSADLALSVAWKSMPLAVRYGRVTILEAGEAWATPDAVSKIGRVEGVRDVAVEKQREAPPTR